MVERSGKKLLTALLLLCVMLSGCAPREKSVAPDQVFLTIHDDLGREVILEKKPERIIALSPSFLAPLGVVKANLVARPTSRNEVPDFAKPLEEIGAVYHINIEKVVAMKPDLVIAYQGMHDKLVPVLEANDIPVVVLRMKTYEEVKDKIMLFGKITGEEAAGASFNASMDDDIQSLLAKTPKESKKIAILHSTAKSVTVERENSIAGSTAKSLGLKNIVSDGERTGDDPDAVPYSLETLVEKNPEIIFVVTMGNLAEIKERMMADVEGNPAWHSLAAVKSKKVFFLPQELFLLNPSIHYPQAFRTMAELIYPEVKSNGK